MQFLELGKAALTSERSSQKNLQPLHLKQKKYGNKTLQLFMTNEIEGYCR